MGLSKVVAWGLARLFVILFLSAGTFTWVAGWCFFGLSVVNQMAMAAVGGRHRLQTPVPSSPGLRVWRLPKQLLASLSLVLVAGLNYRFDWPPAVGLEVQLAAWGLGVAGILINLWAMSVNTFFHGVEGAGRDGHRLLTQGPYSLLRHPSSLGVLLLNLSKPLMLGSFWALVPAMVVAGLVCLHTSREDRTLRNQLAGYGQYCESVRYRVLPGIW